MGKLDGRVAIVTGAAHGERAALGAVFAKALAREGAQVTVADIKDTADVATEIEADGGAALPLIVDVGNEAQIRDMVAKTVERFGRLDILVNNAAIGSNIPSEPVTQLSVADWDALMAINVRGPFLCVKAATPQMQAQKYGKIINIGSTTMMTGLTHRLHYVSAKGAILAMSRSLAEELGPDGIRVNTFAYGLITSRLNQQEIKNDPAREEKMLRGRGLRQHVRAKDLTGSLVFLASADSDHMTGQTLIVDGGEYYY